MAREGTEITISVPQTDDESAKRASLAQNLLQEQAPNSPDKQNDSKKDSTGFCCTVIMGPLFFIVLILTLLFWLLAYLLFGIRSRARRSSNRDLRGWLEKANEYGSNIASSVRTRVMIWSLLLLLIARTAPNLKRVSLLGLHLWQWAFVLFFVCLGSQVLSWATHLVVMVIKILYGNNPTVVYWAQGLRRSVAHVIFFAVLLVIWVRYCYLHLDLQDWVSRAIVKYGTWALVSLVIGAVLWLVKSVLLLSWEAHSIYSQFEDRVFKVGIQLYSLGLICGLHLDTYKPKEENEDTKKEGEKTDDYNDVKDILYVDSEGKSPQKKFEHTQLHDVQRRAEIFIGISTKASRDDSGHLFAKKVSETCDQFIKGCPNENELKLEELIRKQGKVQVNDAEAKILHAELQGCDSSKIVSKDTFKKYMNTAYKNSLDLGRTLSDAKEVVRCLDTILSAFMVVVIIIAWLLLTGLATTQVLVVIVSPFLAATFIFGNTCKTIFEGIIFSFVTRPFDVGDLCIIDDTQMEVKRIGILETTFIKIDGKEEVLYPTSVLATKSIVNLKGDPDLNDHVELCLDNAIDSTVIDSLKHEVEWFLSENKTKYEKSSTVVVKEIGSNIKITIHFKHRMGSGDVLHAQCIAKKNIQKSEFLIALKKHLDKKNH